MFRSVVLLLSVVIVSSWSAESLSVNATGETAGPGHFAVVEILREAAARGMTQVAQGEWLSFALWGRLAYEPTLPEAVFHKLIAARFPGTDVPCLSTAWAQASRTFPLITRFFWGDIDLKWLPESCSRKNGGRYLTVLYGAPLHRRRHHAA